MRNPETRIYGTTLAQPFHTDISDIVGECGMGRSSSFALHCYISLCSACLCITGESACSEETLQSPQTVSV